VADKDPQEIEARLWKDMEDHRVGMLGLTGGQPQQLQPMTAFWDAEARSLFFYTSKDTDLVRDVGGGHAGLFIFINKDHSLWASLGGDLTEEQDRGRIEKFWSPFVAAWFPNGKDDPKLTLLRFKPVEADVWINDKGPVRFGLEILKGNAPGKTADGGVREHLELG